MNAIDKEKLKALMKKYENVCDIQTHIDKDTNLAKALIIARGKEFRFMSSYKSVNKRYDHIVYIIKRDLHHCNGDKLFWKLYREGIVHPNILLLYKVIVIIAMIASSIVFVSGSTIEFIQTKVAFIIAVVLSSLLICMLMCTYDSKMTSYLGLGHKRSNGK